jgi:hypothetical protein
MSKYIFIAFVIGVFIGIAVYLKIKINVNSDFVIQFHYFETI